MIILLVNVEKDTRTEVSKFDPLGLAYLASFAKQKMPSINVKVITATDPAVVFNHRADVVGFSSVSQYFGYTETLINQAVRRGLPTLVGGIHISLLPESLPKAGAIGIIGEGEVTFVELLQLLSSKGRFEPKDLAQIRGIAYRDNESRLVCTPPRPLIEPLDSIPMPDRDLINVKKNGSVYLFSSRGCPFQCIFCASTRLYKGVRFLSADYVVKEIQLLVDRYNPILIKFYDDLFVASKPRLREIVERMRAVGLHRKVLFSVNASASMIDEETAQLLRDMNVYTVGMGLESGNQEILNFLKGGKATVEQNERAVRLLVKKNIYPTGSFIIGSPGEDKVKFKETLRFISRTRLPRSYLYLLTPYPGTPVWDYAFQKGLVSTKMDWNRLDINQNEDFSRRIVLSDSLSASELQDSFRLFRSINRRNYFTTLLAHGPRRFRLIISYLKLHLRKFN